MDRSAPAPICSGSFLCLYVPAKDTESRLSGEWSERPCVVFWSTPRPRLGIRARIRGLLLLSVMVELRGWGRLLT